MMYLCLLFLYAATTKPIGLKFGMYRDRLYYPGLKDIGIRVGRYLHTFCPEKSGLSENPIFTEEETRTASSKIQYS